MSKIPVPDEDLSDSKNINHIIKMWIKIRNGEASACFAGLEYYEKEEIEAARALIKEYCKAKRMLW